MSEMTALPAYYHAIATGMLPATMGFIHSDGQRGLATMQFPIASDAQREMVFHPNRLVRAKASLFALHSLHERFEAEVKA